MGTDYSEFIDRLKEERIRRRSSQKEMAYLIHITQSNYSKVEKGLHRLSYEELKYLLKTQIDMLYVFTGFRYSEKYSEQFKQFTYTELCCFLHIIFSIIALNDYKTDSNEWRDVLTRVKYVPFVSIYSKNYSIFHVIRYMTDSRQKTMADKLGVDIKKYRELEKDRCLPDSEIIWKLYHLYNVSPAIVLKDKNSLIREISTLLEMLEEKGVNVMNIIKLV